MGSSEDKIVWTSKDGDQRKQSALGPNIPVDESKLSLELKRLKSGKGRVVIQVTNLPANEKYCKDLAKFLKKKMAAGGTYKNNSIEINCDDVERVGQLLNSKNIQWKKIGG